MGIFDKILGKKEEEKEPARERKEPKAPEFEKLRRSGKGARRRPEPRSRSASGKEEKSKQEKSKVVKKRKVAKKEESQAHEILLEPLVTEKGALLGQFNKYLFKVHPKANKFQIKQAIEDHYGVKVTQVNIIKISPKKRIHGRTVGWKQGFKKAVVTLQGGDTIGTAEGV